jgi:hypothetical protein
MKIWSFRSFLKIDLNFVNFVWNPEKSGIPSRESGIIFSLCREVGKLKQSGNVKLYNKHTKLDRKLFKQERLCSQQVCKYE